MFITSFFKRKRLLHQAAMALAGAEAPREKEKFEFRNRFVEITSDQAWCNFGLSYDEHEERAMIFVKVPFWTFVFYMPWHSQWKAHFGDGVSFGFSIYNRQALYLKLFRKSIFCYFPFINLNHQKTEILDFGFKPVYVEFNRRYRRSWGRFEKSDGETIETILEGMSSFEKRQKARESVQRTFPFSYVMKNGTLQQRNATVSIERMTHGRKWWPWSRQVRTSIDISFDGEVGKGIGSWKGGVTGCGCTLKPGESPEEALRRMENEREF